MYVHQERMAGVRQADEPWTLEIDLGPFEARFPKMTRFATARQGAPRRAICRQQNPVWQ